MTPGISFSKLSSDEDMLALQVEIRDGRSLFSTDIYVGHKKLADTVSGLHKFKDQIHGGLFNLRFGEFGPEYASGALDVRMHFRKRAKLFVRVLAQSEFSRFEDREFASEATLHLMSEPVLLDNFISALGMLSEGRADHAELEALEWY
ncbi:hypothetical protein [Massilia sp. BSC265]|uniref:hypothetical protein n=1 Tax=Massilia sp. BSC265 TaxID=1549812 RepID=UPI0004E956B8|nr:hypothetical protein [Massilia sp. BSC265]KFI06820.1 hypothetical protein JN27_14240 [Massilia sp. BSC265]